MITFYAEDCNHNIFGYDSESREDWNRRANDMKFVNHVYLDGEAERGMDFVYCTKQDYEEIKAQDNFVDDCKIKYVDGDIVDAKVYIWMAAGMDDPRYTDEDRRRGFVIIPGSPSEECVYQDYIEKRRNI